MKFCLKNVLDNIFDVISQLKLMALCMGYVWMLAHRFKKKYTKYAFGIKTAVY